MPMPILSATGLGMAATPGRGELSTGMPCCIANLSLATKSYFCTNRKVSCTVNRRESVKKYLLYIAIAIVLFCCYYTTQFSKNELNVNVVLAEIPDGVQQCDWKFAGKPSISRHYGHPANPIFGVWGEDKFKYDGEILVEGESYHIKLSMRTVVGIFRCDGKIWALTLEYFRNYDFAWQVLQGASFSPVNFPEVPDALRHIVLADDSLSLTYRISVIFYLHAEGDKNGAQKFFSEQVQSNPNFIFLKKKDEILLLDHYLSDFLPDNMDDSYYDNLLKILQSCHPNDDEGCIFLMLKALLYSDNGSKIDKISRLYNKWHDEKVENDVRIIAMGSAFYDVIKQKPLREYANMLLLLLSDCTASMEEIHIYTMAQAYLEVTHDCDKVRVIYERFKNDNIANDNRVKALGMALSYAMYVNLSRVKSDDDFDDIYEKTQSYFNIKKKCDVIRRLRDRWAEKEIKDDVRVKALDKFLSTNECAADCDRQ